MINWVLGIAIVGFTVYVIVRTAVRIKKGEDPCESCSCETNACCSKK